jgi:hypothetical protein
MAFAGYQTGESNATTGGATGAAASLDTFGTFANSTSVTFTLKGQASANSVNVKAAPDTGAGPNSTFQVKFLPSS